MTRLAQLTVAGVSLATAALTLQLFAVFNDTFNSFVMKVTAHSTPIVIAGGTIRARSTINSDWVSTDIASRIYTIALPGSVKKITIGPRGLSLNPKEVTVDGKPWMVKISTSKSEVTVVPVAGGVQVTTANQAQWEHRSPSKELRFHDRYPKCDDIKDPSAEGPCDNVERISVTIESNPATGSPFTCKTLGSSGKCNVKFVTD